MSKLSIKDLTIKRDNRILINSINYKFESKKSYAILGDNGCGKSSLFYTLVGIIKPQGKIFIDQQELSTLTHKERANKISFLNQNPPAHDYCTAKERIAHGLLPIYGFDFFFNQDQRALVEDIAQRLGITHLLDKPLKKLSGGEHRLVSLAKCLINPNISILIFDEPSTYLDLSQQQKLIQIINEEINNKLIIFSSHNNHFTEQVANHTLGISNYELQEIK